MPTLESVLNAAANNATVNLTPYGSTLTGGSFTLVPTGLKIRGTATINGGVVIQDAVGLDWGDPSVAPFEIVGGINDTEALLKFVGGTAFQVRHGELRGGRCYGQLGIAARRTPSHLTPTEWLIEDLWVHHNGYDTGNIGGTLMPLAVGHTAVQDHSVYIIDYTYNLVQTPMNGILRNCKFGPSPNGAVVKIGGTGTSSPWGEGVRAMVMNDCEIVVHAADAQSLQFQGGATSSVTLNNPLCTLDGTSTVVDSLIRLDDDADATFVGRRLASTGAAVDIPGDTFVEGIIGSLTAPLPALNGASRTSTTVVTGLSAHSPSYTTITLQTAQTSGIVNWSGPQVSGTPPTASFTVDSALNPTIIVNGGASSDVGGSIVGWAWNWGDGTPNTTGASATHTYTTAGTKTITLTVTDNDGNTAVTTRTAAVTIAGPTPPTVRFIINAVSDPLIRVDASASTDDGSISLYTVSWGDGTSSAAQASPLFTHSYAANGVYTISVYAIDNLGALSELAKTVEVSSFALGSGTGCARGPIDFATFLDSYMAYGAHKGTTRPNCHFVAWPNVHLVDLASGQADASGAFGAVGTQTFLGIPISNVFLADYGVGSPGRAEGHTGPLGNDGLFKDRMIATKGYTSGLINKTEIAYPGLQAGAWAAQIPASIANTPSRWDPVKAFLNADHTGRHVVMGITQGGNDLLAFMGAKVVPENPGWAGAIALSAENCEKNIDEIIRLNPPGQKLELVWWSYPNLMVEDGVPSGYPPCSTVDAPFRCVWITNSFGQYYQANDDMQYEINTWAPEKALHGPTVPSFYPPALRPSIIENNRNYWIAQMNINLTSDILNRATGGCGSTARSIDPNIWIATTANVNQQTINDKFHRLRDAQALTAAKYQVGQPKYNEDVSVIYIDMTTALDPDPLQSGVSLTYRSAPKAKFAEGIHMNKSGFIEYWDKGIAAWFPRSQFRDISCLPNALPDVMSMANNTPGTLNPTDNDDPGGSTFAAVELHNTLTSTWVTTLSTAFTGTWTVSGLNVTFTPLSTFVGTTTVEYRFRTGDGRYASSTITATVAPVPPNCPPQLASLYVT